MTRRLRSPSLFITFAGAFLGVLLLGTLLQVFVVVRLVGSIRERIDRSNAEALVHEVAREVALELTTQDPPNVARVLDRYPTRPDSLLLVYEGSDGSVVLPSLAPRRMSFVIRRLLSGEALPAPEAELSPGADGPGPPRQRGAPRRWPRRGPRFVPRIVGTAEVSANGTNGGRVLALSRRPPPGALPSLTRDTRGLLLFLPLAILLAGGAGLLVFRSLFGRLRKLEAATARVAEGDLAVRVEDPGADEIARLGTAFNRMTARLAAAKRDVDDSQRQQRQLFADISHELATPLTSIRGYTETLLNRDVPISDAERQTYLRHILDASTRMGLLAEDLLELTRLESGTIALHKERLNWTKLCVNTLQRFEPRFRDARLRLEWVGPQDDAWISADGRRMEQVIDNLLANALRYVPAGGHVSVALRAARTRPAPSAAETGNDLPRHRLRVSDDGAGFPPGEVEHVFDRFFRGRAQSDMDGSGLGLAIVREIVRSHGGEVRASNREPSGAMIEVELPAAPD